jgi:hypothetical protein
MMKKWLLIPVFVSLLAVVALVGAQDGLPTLSELEPGLWTPIPTGGETLCSNGTPYQFYARPAETESDKLLIHFQGGGACWAGFNCDVEGTPSYDPLIDEDNDPNYYGGFFNFENEENPFLDYNMVMVPYCTGDVHLGNQDTTYENGDREFTIHHRGMTNSMAVLDWTFENIQAPETVFVTGCSAGAIPSPYYTQFVAAEYPDARIEHLADSGGAYRNPEFSPLVFEAWGTVSGLPDSYEGYTNDTLNFERFYIESATMFPDITFTQFNHAYDGVQTFFLGLTGLTDFELPDLLRANFEDIKAGTPNDNFYTYLSGGSDHCITPTDDVYTRTVGDARLVDWVAALAAGEDVQDVVCAGDACEEAETVAE